MLKVRKNIPIQPTKNSRKVLPQDTKENNQDIKDRNDTKPPVIIAGDRIIKRSKWENDVSKNQHYDSLLSWINHGRYDRFCEAASEEESKSFHISCRYLQFIL